MSFISGKEFFAKAFNNNYLTDFMETIKNNSKTQKDLELFVNNYSNEPYRKQSRIEQTALLQRTIVEEAKKINGRNK